MAAERPCLLPRAAEGFDPAEAVFPLVNKPGCVAVKANLCSAPIKAGIRVEARVYAQHVEVWHAGRRVARHERCYSRRQQALDLEHCLGVLKRKPGAFAGSKPLEPSIGSADRCFADGSQERWRAAGRWPLAGLLRRTLGSAAGPAWPAGWRPGDGGGGHARA